MNSTKPVSRRYLNAENRGRPDNLHAKIPETNDRGKLTERPSTAAAVESLHEQAKELPKILTY